MKSKGPKVCVQSGQFVATANLVLAVLKSDHSLSLKSKWSTNRPFAISHSRGTKPPCWRVRAFLHGVGDPGLVRLVSFVFTLWGTQNKRNLPH